MNMKKARKLIRGCFKSYKNLPMSDHRYIQGMTSGKLYELVCLSNVLNELKTRHSYYISLQNNSIRFQSAPGYINRGRPYFELRRSPQGPVEYELFLDVQFETLGCEIAQHSGQTVSDRSGFHEIDILVINAGVKSRKPKHDQIVLGVECKSHTNFYKGILKEVLGIRREMAFLSDKNPNSLTGSLVPAMPPSEYWLVYHDPMGSQYSESPECFGITFHNWQP